MRHRISLVFFLVFFGLQRSFAAGIALPPTLRVTVQADHAFERLELERVVAERFAVWPMWTIEFGPRLENAPCSAHSPRAGLIIHLTSPTPGVSLADVGLVDCSAWPLERWSFTSNDAVDPARDVVGHMMFALRLWEHHDPARFAALFDTGDATARDGFCHPEMSLVKTADGQLRAVVRAGGPAYRAGLRSNDIIAHIDGRDWWEYGTYRSQQLAIDGQEHSYTRPESPVELRVRCH